MSTSISVDERVAVSGRDPGGIHGRDPGRIREGSGRDLGAGEVCEDQQLSTGIHVGCWFAGEEASEEG